MTKVAAFYAFWRRKQKFVEPESRWLDSGFVRDLNDFIFAQEGSLRSSSAESA